MSLFWIWCVCLFLYVPTSNSVPFPNNRCSKNDCSYQLQDIKNDTCKVYNTSVCLDFYKFDKSSEETLASEQESKFHVSIIPYTAELLVFPATVIRSAVNITFTINDTDIDELVVKIYTEDSSKPICRMFDFHNANNSTDFPINLFYDCLYNLAEHDMQNVRMDFIALPVKEKLSYYVFIPGTEYPGSCTRQLLIMVFRGSLHNGIVQVKFSQALELYNVSSYKIKLTEHNSGSEKIIDTTPDISKIMLFAQFLFVDRGSYSVSVKPVIWGVHDNCWTETEIFLVEIPKSDHMLIVYLCIFILLIFSALVFLKMFRHNIAKSRFGSKRRVLLLYSHDCDEHKDFVIAFIQYLTKHCHVEVSTIYDELPIDWNPDANLMNIPGVNECNPQEWIKKKYNDCDIFMYLISEGLFRTLDSNNSFPIKKYHEWRKQLLSATNFILRQINSTAEDVREKKICKVYFPYSKKEYIPDALHPGFGKCYALPKKMNKLINYMHDSRECFQCSKLGVINFESSFEGTDLFRKMRAVKEAVDNGTHIRIIEQFIDTSMNDLNSIEESENLDESSSISDSSDENSVINVLGGSSSKLILKERFENLSSSGSPHNIHPMLKSEDFVELPPDEFVEDSDSEESDIYHKPKLHSENEAKYVVENILNKNYN